MDKGLMEAHINSSGASKTEIANSFNEAYDVIRRIAKKYNGMVGRDVTIVDQVTFVVSFVHPEVKGLNRTLNDNYKAGSRHTPGSILDAYAAEPKIDIAAGRKITEANLPYVNQPMVSLLNAVSGGVLNKLLNAQPRGAHEDDDSSSFGAEEFERKTAEIQKFILDNDSYTTKGFIGGKIRATTDTDKAAALSALDDQIDYDSLFGFHRSDVTGGAGGDNAWGVLENLEHWFYALVSNNITLDNKKVDPAELGESVFTYVKGLRNILTQPDVVRLLNAIDRRIMDPSVDDVEIAGNEELHLNGDLFQLGVLMCMSANSTVADGQKTPLFTYLIDQVDANEYASGIEKLREFVQSPYIDVKDDEHPGETKRIPLVPKVGTDAWSVATIAEVAQSNAQEHGNPVAAKLAKQLSRKQPVSATLNMLASSGIATATIKGKYSIVVAIANMVSQYRTDAPSENIEGGLVPNSGKASDTVGLREKLSADEKNVRANVNKPPMDLAGEFVGQALPKNTQNLLTQRETEVSILDPNTDDVRGSAVLPKWSIPMFAAEIQFAKGDDENEQHVSNLASALIAYLAIAINGDEIKRFPWFDKWTETEENGEGDTPAEITDVYIGREFDVDAVEVAKEIDRYFKWVVTESTDPSNVVRLRNGWVNALNDASTWGRILHAVQDYLRWYIDNRLQVADEGPYTAEATKEALARGLGDTIIPGARDFVNRNVFNVKEGSRDVQLSNDLIAVKVKSISPINLAENGRLRESGGTEGTVTADGKELLNNTMGRVVKVSHSADNRGGTAGNNEYTVYFKKGSGLVTGEFSDRMLDNWIPDGLVLMVDSASKSAQYSLWVGVNFVDVQTMEGNLGSFRTSPEEIAASNQAYMDTVVGSPSYTDARPNAKEAANFLDTVSAPALGAVRRAGDIIAKNGSKTFNQIYDMLRFAASPDVAKDRQFDEATQMANIGRKPVEKAVADIFSGVVNVFAATKMEIEDGDFYCDIDSTRTLHELLAICGEDVYRKYPTRCLVRLASALGSLTAAPETAETPFVIEHVDGNLITIGNTGEDISHTSQFEGKGNGEKFKSLINELNADARGISQALQDKADNLDSLYRATMEHLKGLTALFDAELRDAFAMPSTPRQGIRQGQLNIERTIAQYAPLLTSQEAYDTLSGILGEVVPELRQSPEVMNKSIMDVLNATYYARQIPSDLAASREPHIDYDVLAAHADKRVFTGSEGAEEFVTPDYTGERDDFSGSMLSNGLDHEALMNFDADKDTRVDFDGVSQQFPMMNMISCDPRGMYSGNGSFNVSTGISPTELEQVAAALDSAHETVLDGEWSPRGKNVAIDEYVAAKNYSIDKVIDSFYGFFASNKMLAQRNIMQDALDVGRKLESAVDEDGDITVRHMLTKVLSAYVKVVSGVFNQYRETEKNADNIARIEADAARRIATAMANIILYLNSEIETEMPSADPSGLEVYGKRNRDGYEINSNIADKFATASAINPDAKRTQTSTELGKRVLSLTKTRMTKEIRSKFRDSMDYGVNEVDRFADTLTNIYERIGKSATLGYENAISPFDDLIGKSQAKHDKPYNTLYTGESRNDLGATVMFAIVSDERVRTPGTTTKYGMLEGIIRMLTGNVEDAAGQGHQTPIAVPRYILKGLYTAHDSSTGATNLDYDTIVWAMFREDGSSVIGNGPEPDAFSEQPPVFTGLEAIGAAIGIPLANDDTIDEAVSKIRTAIIQRKLDNNSALETLSRKDAGTNTKIYSETIENFVDTMLAAASVTMETPTTFVPLSVLYTCLDDKALNTAMHNVIEKSAELIRDRQKGNASSEIMRSVVGSQYGEIPEVGEIAEENEDYLVDDFVNALRVMKSDVGTPQARLRASIVHQNSNEVDGEEINIPGSSLKEIFGKEKAEECVNLLMQQVPMHVLAAMDEDELEAHARKYVQSMKEKNNVIDAGEPLARIANDLFGIADGGTSLNDGLADITSTIGARNQTMATKLAAAYFRNLGVNMPTDGSSVADIADISPARMRNVALQTVNRELNTKGEFRSLFLHKYPTEENRELQARKVMHGKVHPFGTSAIGDVNGLSVMYEKVKNALNGTMDADESADLLSGALFNIDGVTGSAAITAFNKYFAELKKKLSSVVRSTFTGVDAFIKLQGSEGASNEANREKVNANRCPTEDTPAGPAMELALKKLGEVKQLIVAAIGKESTNSIAIFNRALDAFMDKHCRWNSDMDAEALASVKAASKVLGNKQLDADYVALRDGMAEAFATSDNRYQRDVKSVVGMSSSATGINTDLVLPPSKLKTLADRMAAIKDSPIKHADSDMFEDEYEIDGKPVSWNRCMVILNSALHMCGIPDSGDGNVPVRDLISEELFQCVRRCASSVRDLPLMPDSIASILLSTMFKKKLVTLSPVDGCVRMKHRFKAGWFTFDIPVSTIYDLVEDKISHTDLSKSLNEWKAFSEEVDRYTNAGNRLNSYKITNRKLGNQLWDLFSSVQRSLISRIDGYLSNLDSDDYERLCTSKNGMETDDGIHITKSKVAYTTADDSATAFPERRRAGDEREDLSQEIEFPERFPRERRPAREPEEPEVPEQETAS